MINSKLKAHLMSHRKLHRAVFGAASGSSRPGLHERRPTFPHKAPACYSVLEIMEEIVRRASNPPGNLATMGRVHEIVVENFKSGSSVYLLMTYYIILP